MVRDPEFRVFSYVQSDWRVNRRNPRGLVVLFLYRTAHHAYLRWKISVIHRIFYGGYLLFYRFVTEFILGCEIQAGAIIGRSCILDHGFGVVINRSAAIGESCRIRHGVTIGCNVRPDGSQGRSPTVGNFVEFGAHAVAVGNITIGDYVKVAANSLVIADVPRGCKVRGVPAVLFSSFDDSTRGDDSAVSHLVSK